MCKTSGRGTVLVELRPLVLGGRVYKRLLAVGPHQRCNSFQIIINNLFPKQKTLLALLHTYHTQPHTLPLTHTFAAANWQSECE